MWFDLFTLNKDTIHNNRSCVLLTNDLRGTEGNKAQAVCIFDYMNGNVYCPSCDLSTAYSSITTWVKHMKISFQ